jgi:hypothetical protein
VIEVRVEMFSFRDIDSFRGLVVVTSEDVVDVVETTRSKFDFGKICGPDSSVSIFGFILRVVRGIDSVVDISISVFPFLVIVLFEVVVGRVNGKERNQTGKLKLIVSFVQKSIVFLVNHTVTISAISGENLESSSQTAGIISS